MRVGRRREEEVHGEENQARGREFRGVASYKTFFKFYALLSERFSLRIRRVSGHGAYSYVSYGAYSVNYSSI